jgi:hypothetical protein
MTKVAHTCEHRHVPRTVAVSHKGERTIHRPITVRMELQGFRYESCTLLKTTLTQILVGGKQDSAVNRLHAVTQIGDGSATNDFFGVVNVTVLYIGKPFRVAVVERAHQYNLLIFVYTYFNTFYIKMQEIL